ncbi:hypothetical protein GCM10023217_34890 [Gordonia alkaliphila]|uniref:Uncharacterized protein n=1 Tax=Gordonia alkaliphila TaxID=1053547 RepID=A0ABP8ZLY9_9ACTN
MVFRYWLERGSLFDDGEYGDFAEAAKYMAVTLASQYREAKGYEPFPSKVGEMMSDGVEVSTMDGREVCRLIDGDPGRYIPVYGKWALRISECVGEVRDERGHPQDVGGPWVIVEVPTRPRRTPQDSWLSLLPMLPTRSAVPSSWA